MGRSGQAAMKPKAPTEIDCLVGSHVRQQGLTLDYLAQALGITVPQLQKYEKGTNRIGAGHLPRIAALLGASISTFFETSVSAENVPTSHTPARPSPPFSDQATVELAIAFSRISYQEVRSALVAMARAAATLETGD